MKRVRLKTYGNLRTFWLKEEESKKPVVPPAKIKFKNSEKYPEKTGASRFKELQLFSV